jgi:hypothetical protein
MHLFLYLPMIVYRLLPSFLYCSHFDHGSLIRLQRIYNF